MKILDDLDFSDKRVLIRTGFDVPVDDKGNVLDDARIKISIPTIKYVLDKGARQVILIWHMGRPKGREDRLSTSKASERLAELLGSPVKKIDDWGKDCLPDDRIVALENLRFNPAEKSKDPAERDGFGKKLSLLADVFVQDAYSNCHHDHASMTSIPKFIDSCAGRSVEKEVTTLSQAIKDPSHPVAIIFGGLKAEKLDAMKNLLNIADHILVGGALAFLMLKAKGMNVGASKIDEDGLKSSKDDILALADDPKVILPKDCNIADGFSADADSRIVAVDSIEENWLALDIGPEAIKEYRSVISDAKTVLWFGPIGVFEFERFSAGTREIAEAVAENKGVTIIGGGDSSNAVRKLGFSDKMTLVSTGGGASLTLAQGKDLIAIKALE